ncbi:hypothetical protein [Rossellomorea marisflavi]|uniref:hypothetical protein n=1 Tax=Rossellomorea marisflavi TaxID=189381 RepID=UPI001E42197F|nr:hypothetical protein [Rossellomorea marisflavi]
MESTDPAGKEDWFFFTDDECFPYGEMDVLVKANLSLDIKTSYLTWSLPEGVFVKKCTQANSRRYHMKPDRESPQFNGNSGGA